MELIEILKVVVLGIVEGVTEWLPISSTGHMLLVDEFIHMNVSESFKDMFFVVIQLGAILAVVMLFWDKMWPFQTKDKSKPVIRKDVFSMWFKVVVACIPGAIVTLLFDDYIEAHLHTPTVIALALVVYGVAFIVIENWNIKRTPKVLALEDISYKTAFIIGLFQVLSIIPGTSRSGSTIIGALTIGVSRVAAAQPSVCSLKFSQTAHPKRSQPQRRQALRSRRSLRAAEATGCIRSRRCPHPTTARPSLKNATFPPM